MAEHLDLSTATVSLVLNNSPAGERIPQRTRERVLAAVRELGYRPNLLARSLRGRRSFLIGVLVPEISEGYVSGVMTGVTRGLERELAGRDYLHLIANHQSRPELLADYLGRLQDRWVEGLIVIGTRLTAPPPVPTVVLSGHQRLDGVTNVGVDNRWAARLALDHLVELGHRRIAFLRGADSNADADSRWRAINAAARDRGIEIRSELSPRLAGRSRDTGLGTEVDYREGYVRTRELLAASERGHDGSPAGRLGLTALFAFNDLSAIGAMRALREAGLRVPEDVSVIGFDDVFAAEFQNPALTTVRQPLAEIGATGATILSRRLEGDELQPDFVSVRPELVVRASTGPAPRVPRPRRRVANG